jgi:hypothetical protein
VNAPSVFGGGGKLVAPCDGDVGDGLDVVLGEEGECERLVGREARWGGEADYAGGGEGGGEESGGEG